MNVRVEEFEDKGEKDAEGYYYKGKYFYFEDAATKVTVRTYSDTPHEASFLSLNDRPFNAETIRNSLLGQIEVYLKKMGFTKFTILYGKSGTYEPFPISDH